MCSLRNQFWTPRQEIFSTQSEMDLTKNNFLYLYVRYPFALFCFASFVLGASITIVNILLFYRKVFFLCSRGLVGHPLVLGVLTTIGCPLCTRDSEQSTGGTQGTLRSRVDSFAKQSTGCGYYTSSEYPLEVWFRHYHNRIIPLVSGRATPRVGDVEWAVVQGDGQFMSRTHRNWWWGTVG